MSRTARSDKGVSLAKGPVGLIGLAMIAWGVIHFLTGGNGFTMHPVSGTVNGHNFLGLEGNGWTNVLWAAGGLLLAFGAPMHWGAKSMAMIVGLALGAASVISLVDGDDVFGIIAANGPTKLALGAVSAALLVLSLLPRVGKNRGRDRHVDEDLGTRRRVVRREEPVIERDGRFDRDREPVGRRERVHVAEDDAMHGTERRVVAPADGDGIEDRGTTRRRH